MLAPLGPFQAASAERGVKGSVKAPVKGPVKGPYQAQSTTERVMKGPMTSPFHAQSTERAMRGGRGGMGGGLQMGAGVAEASADGAMTAMCVAYVCWCLL